MPPRESSCITLYTAVSERALREIYLKGFEIAVKQGGAKSIMTTYGKVNDLWTAGSFDLNTEILRNTEVFKQLGNQLLVKCSRYKSAIRQTERLCTAVEPHA